MSTDSIPDESVSRLRSADVRSYALHHGWHRAGTFRDSVAVFNRADGTLNQLLVPMDSGFDDFTLRMREALRKLGDTENRPVGAILNDLFSVDSDTLRFSIRSPQTEKGTVPLEGGLRLLEGARRSLLSAASSVLAPNNLYHQRMSRSEASEFLEACEMGQTEQGSFTVTVRCPLYAGESLLDAAATEDEPFGRKTTTILAESAARLVMAIDSDDPESLLHPVPNSPMVTANLCDALLRMQPDSENASLSLSVAWASSRPVARTLLQPVLFRSEHFPAIARIYKELRPEPASHAALFLGQVDELRGHIGESARREGEIRLSLLNEDEIVKARANLTAEQYALADQAHMQARKISVTGILDRGPRLSNLREVGEFRILSEELLLHLAGPGTIGPPR